MERPCIRISVRNLVEFILRSGDLDNRRSKMADKEAMLMGGKIHRKIQKKMESAYQAEVSLRHETISEDISIQVEGRADGISRAQDVVLVDEIKGVYRALARLESPVEVHEAQAKCYAYFYRCTLVCFYRRECCCLHRFLFLRFYCENDYVHGTERLCTSCVGTGTSDCSCNGSLTWIFPGNGDDDANCNLTDFRTDCQCCHQYYRGELSA